jgi:hypothetical protein
MVEPPPQPFPVDMRGRSPSPSLGTTVQIADVSGRPHTVLTNEGPLDPPELARLQEEMLRGNGFIIARGVVPPELCQVCRHELLRRGPEARRTSDILRYRVLDVPARFRVTPPVQVNVGVGRTGKQGEP